MLLDYYIYTAILYCIYLFIVIKQCGQTFDTLVADASHTLQILLFCFSKSYIYIHTPPLCRLTSFLALVEFEEKFV